LPKSPELPKVKIEKAKPFNRKGRKEKNFNPRQLRLCFEECFRPERDLPERRK